MSTSAPLTNIFPSHTSFRGRDEELRQIEALLADGRRLISVIGPGGIGKTRLVRQFADHTLKSEQDRFPGGVWFVDLTEARDRPGMVEMTAEVLGVAPEGESGVDFAGSMSARGPMLLVMDNFEQLPEECRDLLLVWLDQSPETAFLVTSRHRLQLFEEILFDLRPLPLPPKHSEDWERVERIASVALFVDRVRSLKPDYAPSIEELGAIAQIVNELDGLPLAIELAAARMRILSPGGILERLTRRFELLSTKVGSLHGRQTRLRQVLDWSWNLLDPTEQTVAAQLSVFDGGFSLEAVESIVDLPQSETRAPLDVIQQLRDKSLIAARQTGEHPAETRLYLPKNLKEYLAERAFELDVQRTARERHARYFAERSREWHDGFNYRGNTEMVAHLRRERENLLAVLHRTQTAMPMASSTAPQGAASQCRVDFNCVLSVLLALNPVFTGVGRLEDYLSSVERAQQIAAVDDRVDRLLAIELTISYGRALRFANRLEDSQDQLDRARSEAEAIGADRLFGQALYGLASVHVYWGESEEAQDLNGLAIDAFRRCGEQLLEARALNLQGATYHNRSDSEAALETFRRGLDLAAPFGDSFDMAMALLNLGTVLYTLKGYKAAQETVESALAVSRNLDNPQLESSTLGLMGELLLHNNPCEYALDLLEQSAELSLRHGYGISAGRSLMALGLLQVELGRIRGARETLNLLIAVSGASSKSRTEPGHPLLAYFIAWASGDLQTALDKVSEAESAVPELEGPEVRVQTIAHRAALKAQLGDVEGAEADLQAARTSLGEAALPTATATIEVCQGVLVTAQAKRAFDNDDDSHAVELSRQSRQCLTQFMRNATLGASSPVDFRSRWAARVLDEALTDEERLRARLDCLEGDGEAFVVNGDCSWFRTPQGETVDLSTKSKLLVLLSALVAMHAKNAPPVTLDELVDLVWPGERIIPEAAKQRVHVAISTLRKLGLGEGLQRDEDGYFLDPGLSIIWLTPELFDLNGFIHYLHG